jgi:hypothetical protein
LQTQSPFEAQRQLLERQRQEAARADLTRRQEEEKDLQERLLREVLKDSVSTLTSKLNDEQPTVRAFAALAIGKRRLHLETTLIGMLADPHPDVRQAARQSLVRLARGSDFGPRPTASAHQLVSAQAAWEQWLLMQDPPARSDESASPSPASKPPLQAQAP